MIAALILATSTFCVALEQTAPAVKTLAGSTLGVKDGAASDARFLTPAGIAVDAKGGAIIADPSGQRIKRLDDAGHVKTIAGSGSIDSSGVYVDGGYKDGPAAEAKFHNPNGVAVAPNGDIYVADTDNDAVRLIRGGVVSTVIGGPGKRGPDLGPGSTVTATRVLAVATDSAGNLYFANERGLRILQPSGKVVRFNDDISPVYAVSVYGSGASRAIYEITSKGIEYSGPGGSTRILRSNAALVDGQSNIAADDLIGSPIGISAISDREAAVTDPSTGAVYILDAKQGRVDYTFGSVIQSHSGDEALERDGGAAQARFNEPWGVAYIPKTHAVLVSDAGSARIRQISGFGLRGPEDGASVGEAAQAMPPTIRIALIGNSFAYFHTNYSESIEGHLERTLSSRSGRCVMVDAIGLGSNLNAYRSFISAYADFYDIVILQLNGTQVSETFGPKPPRNYPFDYDGADLANAAAKWAPGLTRFLIDEESILRAAHHKLLVVAHPYPEDVSSNEMLWNRFIVEYGPGMLKPENRFEPAFDAAIKNAGVSRLNLWAAFKSAEIQKICALFGTQNVHFSKCGRRLVAGSISDYLIQSGWMR